MTHCPSCHHPHNEHTATDGSTAPPEPGELSICWYCAAPAIYERSPLGVLRLRLPTLAEELALGRDPDVAVVLTARSQARTVDEAAALTAARLAGPDRPEPPDRQATPDRPDLPDVPDIPDLEDR